MNHKRRSPAKPFRRFVVPHGAVNVYILAAVEATVNHCPVNFMTDVTSVSLASNVQLSIADKAQILKTVHHDVIVY